MTSAISVTLPPTPAALPASKRPVTFTALPNTMEFEPKMVPTKVDEAFKVVSL